MLEKILFRLQQLLVVVVRLIYKFKNGKGAAVPPIEDPILLESATSLAEKIRKKELKSRFVVRAFIERIQKINPITNCVVDRQFDEALRSAHEADELIESGKYSEEELAKLKPFLGVPISTKDAIRVKGFLFTAGIWARRNIRAQKDGDAMRLMREAGAIPFAMTNVSEVCMWWESNNTVHGRTKNAYDTNRIVGGSSGGEGCLLSAAGSPFGLGSDIGGSIRMPAFFNGVFGHKPSKYIVSNYGQHPQPHTEHLLSYLSIGPMSRFASDLKPMLKILAGENATKLKLDEEVDLSKLKVYYQEDCGGAPLVSDVEDDIKEALRRAVKHFDLNIKSKIERTRIAKLKESAPIWLANMKTNTEPRFNEEMVNCEGKVNCHMELLKCIFGKSNHTLIAILTALVDSSGHQFGTPEHQKMVVKKEELIKEFTELLGDNGVFFYPTHPTAAPYHNETFVRAMNFSYTSIFNSMGLPSCSCPLGLNREGLPIGIQVVANWNQDRLCLAVAKELEKAFGGWVAPNSKK